MGSTNFDTIVRGAQTMEEAYSQAKAQAIYDHGHDPYSGTIATTRGVVLAPDLPKGATPITVEEAQAHLGVTTGGEYWWDRDNQPQKWESAWAIPLAAEPDAEPGGWDDKSQPGWLFYGWAAC